MTMSLRLLLYPCSCWPNSRKAPRRESENVVELLERLVKNSPVSPAMNAFLLKTMADSQTGLGQLRAGLPPGTTLAHKTGHSGTHGGVTAATNDIGLVTLPDGRKLAIAVFVTDSR